LNDAGPRDWVAVLKSRRHSGATDLLGMEPLEFDTARGRSRIAYDGGVRFTNRAGVVQGGILAAMLDEGMALAAVAMDEFRTFVPTLELKVSFVAPARPGRFVVESQVVRKGKSVAFAEGRLFDAAGELVATASTTMRVVPREKVIRR
jgi:uncharacterized protein (TIGR00369 family)